MLSPFQIFSAVLKGRQLISMKAEFPAQLPHAPAEPGRIKINYWKICDKIKSHPYQHNSKYIFTPSQTASIGFKAEGGICNREAHPPSNLINPLVSHNIYIHLPLQQLPTISSLSRISPFLHSFISFFYLLWHDKVSKYK